jgi:coatomer protein complex subunit gamma
MLSWCCTPPQSEASEVFFSVTKLFQHKDVHLRRMVYLVIKEIIPSSDEVIIITSSLMKDMNSKNDLYRANAIRVLCRIIDSQMLLQIERYLKQAVVDKSAVVASAVLAGAIHLASASGEVIKRWSNEVQEAITSRHPMVQFQAVALMHALRANDRLAVSKLVTQLTRSNVRSPMAQCLLVRYVAQVRARPGGYHSWLDSTAVSSALPACPWSWLKVAGIQPAVVTLTFCSVAWHGKPQKAACHSCCN